MLDVHINQSLTLEEYWAEQAKTDTKLEQITVILQQMKSERYSVEEGH